jgi:hypothetical protein
VAEKIIPTYRDVRTSWYEVHSHEPIVAASDSRKCDLAVVILSTKRDTENKQGHTIRKW